MKLNYTGKKNLTKEVTKEHKNWQQCLYAEDVGIKQRTNSRERYKTALASFGGKGNKFSRILV